MTKTDLYDKIVDDTPYVSPDEHEETPIKIKKMLPKAKYFNKK